MQLRARSFGRDEDDDESQQANDDVSVGALCDEFPGFQIPDVLSKPRVSASEFSGSFAVLQHLSIQMKKDQ